MRQVAKSRLYICELFHTNCIFHILVEVLQRGSIQITHLSTTIELVSYFFLFLNIIWVSVIQISQLLIPLGYANLRIFLLLILCGSMYQTSDLGNIALLSIWLE